MRTLLADREELYYRRYEGQEREEVLPGTLDKRGIYLGPLEGCGKSYGTGWWLLTGWATIHKSVMKDKSAALRIGQPDPMGYHRVWVDIPKSGRYGKRREAPLTIGDNNA